MPDLDDVVEAGPGPAPRDDRPAGAAERSHGPTAQPLARLELGCRHDDQVSHRPPHGTMSCARNAAAGRPPAAPSPSSRRFRTSFSFATVNAIGTSKLSGSPR